MYNQVLEPKSAKQTLLQIYSHLSDVNVKIYATYADNAQADNSEITELAEVTTDTDQHSNRENRVIELSVASFKELLPYAVVSILSTKYFSGDANTAIDAEQLSLKTRTNLRITFSQPISALPDTLKSIHLQYNNYVSKADIELIRKAKLTTALTKQELKNSDRVQQLSIVDYDASLSATTEQKLRRRKIIEDAGTTTIYRNLGRRRL